MRNMYNIYLQMQHMLLVERQHDEMEDFDQIPIKLLIRIEPYKAKFLIIYNCFFYLIFLIFLIFHLLTKKLIILR